MLRFGVSSQPLHKKLLLYRSSEMLYDDVEMLFLIAGRVATR